jgi:hypothetical protein
MMEDVLKLNKIIDDIGDSIRGVEAQLEGVGIPCSVKMGNENRLMYSRINGKYRIGVESLGSTRTWEQCSREMKLEIYQWLPRLYNMIHKEVIRRIAEAEMVVKETKNLMES